MATHDPRKAIELLRNHLATHDQHLVFLFGAGTSCAVIDPASKTPLIPAVDALTKDCGDCLTKASAEYANAWKAIVEECDSLHLSPNIETILSRVRAKLLAMGPKDSSLGLSRDKLVDFEKLICDEIAKKVSPAESSIPDNIAHDHFAQWLRRIRRKSPAEVFTTNYDILIERSMERAQVPVFDGFSGSHRPFFNTECFEDETQMPPREWVRLWKLHGSINWVVVTDSTHRRIVRDATAAHGEMILPSHLKYDESRKLPYQALMDRLRVSLRQPGALLITCGFSFSDQHINAIVLDALENQPLTHVISLQYGDVGENSELTAMAKRCANFLVFGKGAAVIQGVWGNWQLANPIDPHSGTFMNVAFEPDDPAKASGGKLKLGDFNAFCQFLETMEIAGGVAP